MVMETIITGLFGGGTGIIGSLIGRVAGIFEAKQKIKQLEIELMHELKLQHLQNQAAQNERESDEVIEFDKNATKALIGSYEHDTGYSNTYLRWVRPALTVLLILASMGVYSTMQDDLTKNEIAMQIVFSCGMAISWWFADRSGKNKT